MLKGISLGQYSIQSVARILCDFAVNAPSIANSGCVIKHNPLTIAQFSSWIQGMAGGIKTAM